MIYHGGFPRLMMATVLATSVGMTAAAQRPNDAAIASAAKPAPGRDITGIWTGSFTLDSAWQLTRRPSSRTVSARLVFASVGDATPMTSSPRSVHRGEFDIDFSPFGFVLATREALGWSLSDDAMRALLNPTVDREQVQVQGMLRGETAVGTWTYVGERGGARGTFRLVRQGIRR